MAGEAPRHASQVDALGLPGKGHNVKRWRGGEMALRGMACGMLDAERSVRRVKASVDYPNSRSPCAVTAVNVDVKEVRDFPTAA